jgi:hypothetical protein
MKKSEASQEKEKSRFHNLIWTFENVPARQSEKIPQPVDFGNPANQAFTMITRQPGIS